ncbi:MAG: HEAT repeat domain-containing protein [Planctomycetota bacterium]
MNQRLAASSCVSLALTALLACANPDTAPTPLTESERAALTEPVEHNYGPTGDKTTLFNSLDLNLRTWNDTAAKQLRDDLRLRNQLGAILTRQVFWNFDTILNELKTGNQRNRVIAAAALGFTPTISKDDKEEPRSRRAVPALLEALDEGDDLLTQNAMLALQQIADPDTPREPIFKLLLNHHNPEVRANAALAAARLIRPEEASRWLAELSAAYNSDDEPKVKLHVVKALGNTKHADAAFVLTRALNDKTPTVQAAAADALGNLGFPEACRYLIDKLDAGVAAVRDIAHDALCRLAGKDYGTRRDDWQDWCNAHKK